MSTFEHLCVKKASREGLNMDIVMGNFDFPNHERPVTIHRQFPNPESVDGFYTDNMSLTHVPCTDPEVYSFKVWSRFERFGFRVTPRQDIDLKLAQLNLPPSDFLLRNHAVIKQDDLDQHLDYRDPESYGLIIEMSRAEFVSYYKLLITSPFLQDNYNTFNLTWEWRDLPIDCENDYNFLLYHFPEGEYDIGAPVTRAEMLDIFREVYPSARSDIELRIIIDGNAGDYGNIFISEDLTTEDDEEDGRLRLGRTISLCPSDFTVSGDIDNLFSGLVPNPYPEVPTEDEDEEVIYEYESSLDYTVFGGPDQQLYVDDLIGPDSEESA